MSEESSSDIIQSFGCGSYTKRSRTAKLLIGYFYRICATDNQSLWKAAAHFPLKYYVSLRHKCWVFFHSGMKIDASNDDLTGSQLRVDQDNSCKLLSNTPNPAQQQLIFITLSFYTCHLYTYRCTARHQRGISDRSVPVHGLSLLTVLLL